MKEFYERIRYCAKKVGGQTHLARLVSEREGRTCTPQAIQYLCRGPEHRLQNGKSARSSGWTHAVADVAKVHLTWLLIGEGLRDSDEAGFSSEMKETLAAYSMSDLPVELIELFTEIRLAYNNRLFNSEMLSAFRVLFKSMIQQSASDQRTLSSESDSRHASVGFSDARGFAK